MDPIIVGLVDLLRSRYANVGKTCDLAKYLESFPMDIVTTMVCASGFCQRAC